MIGRLLIALCLAAGIVQAQAQTAVLQGGPWTAGHIPQYNVGGGSQPVIQDGGRAVGGNAGANPSELGVTARGTGTPPYVAQGSGPYGTNICDYDAPTSNATGYHYLCLSANSQGGGLIAYGAGGAASSLPLHMILNGTTYSFPFTLSGIVGPNTTVVGHLATWNNTTGTLLADASAISGISVNGAINPMETTYGAKCDGTTDDAAAFQAALNALGTAGNALYIPPSTNGCVIGTTLTATKSPLYIFGAGPKSQLIITAAGGGISLTGSCGQTYERNYLSDFSLTAKNAGNPAFGIVMNGIATFGLRNVSINASVSGTFTRGISLLGTQQGFIEGGYDLGSGTGVYLNNCNFNAANVSSNGVHIGGGRTFSTSVAAIDVEGGTADNLISDVHITGSPIGIIENRTTSEGGGGPNHITNVHLEVNATVGIQVTGGGTVHARGVNDYNTASFTVVGSYFYIENSLLDGTGSYDAASGGSITNSLLNLGITDNTAAGLFTYNNRGNGTPAGTIKFGTAGAFTSAALAPGDIMLLSPNSILSGAWGQTITGAGDGQDIYLRLGDVTWNGSTGSGSMILKSNVGGSTWAAFTSGGLNLTGGVFQRNGVSGLSVTKTVRASGGLSDCTMTFSGGILTGSTC